MLYSWGLLLFGWFYFDSSFSYSLEILSWVYLPFGIIIFFLCILIWVLIPVDYYFFVVLSMFYFAIWWWRWSFGLFWVAFDFGGKKLKVLLFYSVIRVLSKVSQVYEFFSGFEFGLIFLPFLGWFSEVYPLSMNIVNSSLSELFF